MERYESLGVVGEGSYGLVLRCRHKETGQTVAIKKFLESEDDHSVRKIALREVRMLKKLRHENLVNLIEFFRRKRRLYLVFEFVDHTILDELEATESGLDEAVARAHIFQVLRGIAFCHQNQIIHRDIKPENVLVSRSGVVKLCDFGFARLLAAPGESCTDYVATRWYRAPELLVGDTKYGKEVDIWASGCLLAEMLTADPLFPGESDIDQLFHIIQTIGDLSTPHRLLVERNPMLAGLRLPAAASTPLKTTFPNWSLRVHSFIAACLCLAPTDRPSANQLLSHDFFTHDGFPETFLPILRQRVQQEFSNNVLLQGIMGRRISSTSEKRSGKGRHKPPGGGSPESAYNGNIPRPTLAATKTENPATLKTSPTKQFSQPPVTPSRGTIVPYVSIPPPTRSFSNTNTEDVNGSPPNTIGPTFRDQYTLSNPLPPPSSNPMPTITYNNSSNNNTIELTLHINGTNTNMSPSRTSRAPEKNKRSPINLWGSNLRQRTQALSMQGQGLGHGTSQGLGDDDDSFPFHNEGPPSFTSTFSRHLDMSRNPYTISLDRTKELVSTRDRDHTRDPLREIKDNQRDPPYGNSIRDFTRDNHSFIRDPLRDLKDNNRDTQLRDIGRDSLRDIMDNSKERDGMGTRELKNPSGRPKLEVTGWAKPRLLNDDLSLPSVLGVSSVFNTTTSPKKVENRSRRGVTMPVLGSLTQRNSASSNESSPPASPPGPLPNV